MLTIEVDMEIDGTVAVHPTISAAYRREPCGDYSLVKAELVDMHSGFNRGFPFRTFSQPAPGEEYEDITEWFHDLTESDGLETKFHVLWKGDPTPSYRTLRELLEAEREAVADSENDCMDVPE